MLDFPPKPLNELLSRDPEVVGGELHFTGTRVPLSTVIENLAAGETVDSILYNYPSLSRRHVMAVLEWESHLAEQAVARGLPA